jgi:transposase
MATTTAERMINLRFIVMSLGSKNWGTTPSRVWLSVRRRHPVERELPVRQAGALLRCSDKQLWRRIEFYVDQARASESFEGVQIVGIDETSVRRGQHYITVVHDLHAKRLLFAAEGRDHQTVVDFAADLKAHGGDPAEVRHVCMDMSAAYAKGATLALPQADISYDRFHVVAMAIQAMDDVRREELRAEPAQVAAALQGADPETRRNLLWGKHMSPDAWCVCVPPQVGCAAT